MSSPLKLLGADVRRIASLALVGALLATPATAQDNAKPKPVPDRSDAADVAKYCEALAPSASEARAANQLRRLADLEREVREEVEKLETKQRAAQEWVTKRENMMKQATDDIVEIYAKMAPDAAAGELSDMDDGVAAAILAKLKPKVAGDILAEMQAEKAAKLSSMIVGAPDAEKS